jgi:predicted signal transduction protein with EAL and GGDEF domain
VFGRVHPDDVEGFAQSIEASEQACAPWQQEFRVILPEAGLRWVRASSVPERSDGATVWHGYAEDITSRKLSEQDVWRRANYDSLTGLPNRDLAMDRLEQSMRMCHRNGTGMAIVFADIDGFKEVNDTYVHAMGDRVLAEVGRRLPDCIRGSDTVARMGGDEFVLLLPTAEMQRECSACWTRSLRPSCGPST